MRGTFTLELAFSLGTPPDLIDSVTSLVRQLVDRYGAQSNPNCHTVASGNYALVRLEGQGDSVQLALLSHDLIQLVEQQSVLSSASLESKLRYPAA